MKSSPGAGRYAPSPTGPLHLGNLRTALAAWASARAGSLEFLLRIEDIDTARCRSTWQDAQLRDLGALGIDWDREPLRQSARLDIYTEHFERLRASAAIYPCYCSRKDVAAALSAPHAASSAYPGTCAHLSTEDAARKITEGHQHCWRMRMESAPLVFDDKFMGPREVNLQNDGGDFVVKRGDGLFSYQFVCAIDDAISGVTEVVRADDLLSSGLRQATILHRLDFPIPRYFHIPMMQAAGGVRLSKREGADDLGAYLSRGHDGDSVRSYLAWTLGQCESGERVSAADLAERWNWAKVSRDAVKFHAEELDSFRA